MSISPLSPASPETLKTVENEARIRKGQSNAEEIKNLQKARLNRQAVQDPSLVSKIVALESTMVYNSNAELVQAISPSSLSS
ncbi:hypothetical protein [Desulfonatronovibrio hydrogenovorans]|uniref:hypothetical protein n=1 Tax=Desulfonatronovibrio hydrogenovorans TaxID=53245 RepID=UPI0005587129|nr:hypothetical protein [Desulfonatronovibrio hydrogenovorans]